MMKNYRGDNWILYVPKKFDMSWYDFWHEMEWFKLDAYNKKRSSLLSYVNENDFIVWKRYECGTVIAYVKFDIYSRVFVFTNDKYSYQFKKIDNKWVRYESPHYFMLHKYIVVCGKERKVLNFVEKHYSTNFVLGESKVYPNNVEKPFAFPKFTNYTVVLKKLPCIKSEKFELRLSELIPSMKEIGLVEYQSTRMISEEFNCKDVFYYAEAQKFGRELTANPISIDRTYSGVPSVIVKEMGLIPYEDIDIENLNIMDIMDILNIDKISPGDLKTFLGVYNKLVHIKDFLEGINLYEGFVKDWNVYNYPIIGDYLNRLVKADNWSGLSAYQRSNLYRWIIKIIMLELYTVCNKVLATLKDVEFNREFVSYLNAYFSSFRAWAHSRLDNSIKQHLIRGKIGISKEVYTGFDTEYVPIDFGKNELVSAQLSITGCLKIKVPLVRKFSFEGVQTVTSERYFIEMPSFDRVGTVLKYINTLIGKNRVLLYKEHDLSIRKIISRLYLNKKLFEDIKVLDDKIILKTHKLPIKNVLITGVEGEHLKLNFDVLSTLVNERIYNDLLIVEDEIVFLIQNQEKIYIKEMFEELKSVSWNNETMKNGPVEHIVLSNKIAESYDKLASLLPSGVLENWKSFGSSAKNSLLEFLSSIKYMSSWIGRAGKKQMFYIGSSDPGTGSPKNIDLKIQTLLNLPLPLKEEKTSQNLLFASGIKNYLLAHFNAADLTMLNDWNEISHKNIDILKKSFTSLTKPLNSLGMPVYIRDTLLLSSAAAGTLDKIGKSYNIPKASIPTGYISKMDLLLKEHPNIFKQYAMTDSLITLIHGLFMNDFAFGLGNLRLPNTLGSLSVTYVKNKWASDKYKGYQVNAQYPLGDLQTSLIPRGVNALGFIGESLPMFTGSYRGGRNECFSYGMDKDTRWYDYDLTSCYSTIMSMCGDPSYEEEEQSPVLTDLLTNIKTPDYNKARFITNAKGLDFKNSYTAVKVQFNLPNTIKYPPIPVQLDKNITIYPLQGESLITGLEYQSAINILDQALKNLPGIQRKKYFVKLIYGSYIPFKEGEAPFYNLINELQSNRRFHKKLTGKGSPMEKIYKDLGNMLYGKIVCGISNKRQYSSRLEQMTSLKGNFLANPIIGTWITGFVRALLAELLYKTQQLGGKITAVTTDGFVSNIPDLENKIMMYDQENNIQDSFLNKYRETRMLLSGEPEGLEVKTNVRGIIQWTTRGQISVNHTDPTLNNYQVPIAAMTGFQKYHFPHQENLDNITKVIGRGNKLLYLSKRLAGALDSYKNKTQVSMLAHLAKFRTIFDCKRIVLESVETLKDTKPYLNVADAVYGRTLINSLKQGIYSSKLGAGILVTSPNANIETLKYFLRLVYHHFNYELTEWNIKAIAALIPNISEAKILKILSQINLERGIPLNKMNKFRTNSIFVKNILENITTTRNILNTPTFIRKFKDSFVEVL